MKNDQTDRELSARAVQHKLPESNQPTESGRTKEVDGPKGPEPTRFGDWERKGRCVDF
ncbi:DUF1674 domain-containing protein [Methylomonas sp. MgM2]